MGYDVLEDLASHVRWDYSGPKKPTLEMGGMHFCYMNVYSFILCHQTVGNLRCAREEQASMKFTKKFRLNLKPQTFFREDSGHLFAV